MVQATQDDSSLTRLMTCTTASTVIDMEVFVEEHQIFEVIILSIALGTTMTGPMAILVWKKETTQP